jgi:hypothetical protein
VKRTVSAIPRCANVQLLHFSTNPHITNMGATISGWFGVTVAASAEFNNTRS